MRIIVELQVIVVESRAAAPRRCAMEPFSDRFSTKHTLRYRSFRLIIRTLFNVNFVVGIIIAIDA